MSFRAFLKDEIEILRKQKTGTDFNPAFIWGSIAVVDGMKNLLTGKEVVRNEGNVVVADYRLYIEYTDVTEADIIKSGLDGYNIYSIHNPNNMNRHLEIKMLKLKPGELDEIGVT